MEEEIFRKKSLEKIKSPENLNEYVRIINPGIWLLLISIMIILAGACIWGIFGTIETKINVQADVKDEVAICEVSEDKIDSIEVGMPIRIGKKEGNVKKKDVNNCRVISEIEIGDGYYSAEIITESIRPFAFVIN